MRGVVVLAGLEEHPSEIVRRFDVFGADPNMVHIATRIEFSPLQELIEAVERLRPVLVIVDTLSAMAEGKLEDGSAKAWQPLMAALTKIARDFDCAVLIIHHSRKSDGAYRDSTAIGANVDCIIEMRSDEQDPNARHLKARSRFTVADCAIRYNGSGYELVGTANPKVTLRNEIERYVKDHPGCTLGELRDGVVGSSAKVGNMVAELVEAGVLREGKGARNARRFYPAVSLIQPVLIPVPGEPSGGMS